MAIEGDIAMRLRHLLLSLLILQFPHFLLAQAGMIEGIVETQTGLLISGAVVTLDPQSRGEYVLRRAITNNKGEFSFDHVVPGEYSIYAQKEDDGFGNVGYLFFALGQPPLQRIVVDDGVKAVRVNIGEPGGKITIFVVDQQGNPVSNARYKLSAADEPDKFINIGPRQTATLTTPVPPVPIVLEITASGYQPWHSTRILIARGGVETLRAILIQTPEQRKH